MRRFTLMITLGFVSTILSVLPGCSAITIPVPVSLTEAGVGSFDVMAGVPANAKANFSFTLEQRGGSGRLSIDPANVSIQPTNTATGKVSALTFQEQNACLDACSSAGVAADTCDTVCTQGELLVTIWIGSQDAIAADCASGDQFVFYVVLDASGNATSVSVAPTSLPQSTLDLLNGGSFGACVEVLSPIDGTVVVDTLTFNVGL